MRRGDNTPPCSALFYRRELSPFSSLSDGYTARQTLETLCPESLSCTLKGLIEVPQVTQAEVSLKLVLFVK